MYFYFFTTKEKTFTSSSTTFIIQCITASNFSFFPMRLNEDFSLLSKFLQIYYVLTILFATMATCNEVTFVRNQFNDLGGSIKNAKKSLAL